MPPKRKYKTSAAVGLSRFEKASARAAGTNTTFCQRTNATRPDTAPARNKPRDPRNPRCARRIRPETVAIANAWDIEGSKTMYHTWNVASQIRSAAGIAAPSSK